MAKQTSDLFKLDPPLIVGEDKITLLELAEYDNGRRAVECHSIMRTEDGGDGTVTEPYGRLSVNLPEYAMADPTHFFGMPYDYHRPLYDAAIAAGLMEVVIPRAATAGMHGSVPLCRLTEKATATPSES